MITTAMMATKKTPARMLRVPLARRDDRALHVQ
jgi:hypothetical protein